MNKLTEIAKNWKWPDYAMMFLILVFAAFNKMMPIAMAVAGLSLIVVRNDFQSIKRLLSFKYPFIWFILFFLVHVVGLIHTENMDFGVADIGMKASLIAVPVFLISTKIKLKTKHIINAFLIALLISLVLCYIYAIYKSIVAREDNHWAYFTGSYFSAFMHRSYFATYLAIGTLISVYKFFDVTKGKVLYLILGIVLLVSTVLTFSKAGILILVVMIVPLSYYLIAKYYSRLSGLIAIGVLVITFGVAVGSSSKLSARFELMISGLVNHQSTANTSVESSASRMIMWSTSLEVMSENLLFGVGTGDIRDELDKRNYELGNTGVVEKSLNSHNQYLNSGVQLGLLGLIPFLLGFLTAIFVAVKKRDLLLFIMTAAFMLTMLFESFLETQAGLIPSSLFVLLLNLKALETNDSKVLEEQKNK